MSKKTTINRMSKNATKKTTTKRVASTRKNVVAKKKATPKTDFKVGYTDEV